MSFDYFYHFLQVIICLLVIIESIGQFLECLEEAVEVHLVVVASPDDILVYYIVVGLENMTIGQAGVLRQLLELAARDEVVALLPCQDLEHLLGV